MGKGRMEAFSDGVIAIIITIMVLELRPPDSPDVHALREMRHVFASYLMSFVFVGVYWNNHHHLLQAVTRVNGRILWANMHLLFWLTLVPFATAWIGGSRFAAWPMAVYGVVMIGAGTAYFILVRLLLAHHAADSKLARAIGSDFKGKMSLVLYAAAIPLAFVETWISGGLYVAVTLMWLIPDRRIEQVLQD